MRVPLGYKFILGFLAVVAVAAFVPGLVNDMDVPEWLKEPLSFLIALLVGLILGYLFSKGLTRHFAFLTNTAKKISLGDLRDEQNEPLPKKIFPDETSDLSEALTLVFTNLKELVGHVKVTASNLSESQQSLDYIISKGHETSQEVIAGSSKIFDGALEQANHIDSTSKTVEEVSDIADEVAVKVTDASNASQKVSSMVQRGANTATSAIEKLETIFSGIEKTESAAIRLQEKISDIPRILDVITHISRQTDLLALNATIEASKAGEHGKGFALVAEEVRRFADNTGKSVDDVSMIVKELKVEVERVVNSATEGSSDIKEGRNDIRKIRDILGDITTYTSEVAEKATFILGLTQKQKSKVEKTADVIKVVAGIAQENLSITEKVDDAVERHGTAIDETVSASKKLSILSEELSTVVASFKLGEIKPKGDVDFKFGAKGTTPQEVKIKIPKLKVRKNTPAKPENIEAKSEETTNEVPTSEPETPTPTEAPAAEETVLEKPSGFEFGVAEETNEVPTTEPEAPTPTEAPVAEETVLEKPSSFEFGEAETTSEVPSPEPELPKTFEFGEAETTSTEQKEN
ncbi:MAG: hypothetical protein KAT46_02575 [Deltaproteobacteria bacterium]|nr:hypothetical protein [Deltaproteobacteria bacterium]